MKLVHDGGGKLKCKRKRVRGGNGENNEESLAQLVRRRLENILSPCKASFRDVLRRVERSVGEDCIVGWDFNAIAKDAKKKGGRRKSRVSMEEFCDVLEELSLVNVKTTKGWFTWANNREGNNMVKETLDRFLISISAIDKFLFLDSNVVRQSNSVHDIHCVGYLGAKAS
ncbi:hypothetical protein GOBAR_DD17675 [Gossypium barbadense]|nr:hypothetical protein GOBAR_DD17675 [Gossypium barbadense]